MNLVIDVGNTLVKLAVFADSQIQFKKVCLKKDFLVVLNEIFINYTKLDFCIISMVGNLTEHQLGKLKNRIKVVVLDQNTKIPFINRYATPNTLGVDRIALVSAASQQYLNKNALIIDCGTCITYDFLNDKNEYLGGSISSGFNMRYKALHTFTAKLPLLDTGLPTKLVGDTTASSIHIGVFNGISYEIDGFIADYKKENSNLTVILTGGDAHFLRDRLKNDIFANSNFLLEGLNYILEYNNH